MGIASTVIRGLIQTAVYWGDPLPDGYGGFTFSTPVEISCRWEDRKELYVSSDGNEIVSKAVALINQDLDDEGYLKLCGLADLSEAEKASPKLAGAYQIGSIKKVYDFKGQDVVREVWM